MIHSKIVDKPVSRSKLRKCLGKRIFILKRYFRWITAIHFARTKESTLLPCLVKEHSSILLRELKNVDMWLQHNKIENLRLAIKPINNLVIRPGETFSFWYLVRNPLKSRGFKLGMVLENGKVGQGYGGGLCQLGNLLYWMTIHSPLTVTERYRHSYDVFPDVNRTIPFGCGATLSYNYIDLQITNHTDQCFQLNLWLTDKDLCGEIRSDKPVDYYYKIEEVNHLIQSEIWGGYTRHNQIIRRTYQKATDELINEELLTENHAVMMYNPLLERRNEMSK